MAGRVGGLRKHPHGRVDQLEDRYLGMVEAPSSNLGTSTIDDFIVTLQSQLWPCCHKRATQRFGQVCWLGTSTTLHFIDIHGLDRAATTVLSHIASVVGPHVYHSIESIGPLFAACSAH
jgi:hypothetical protein